MKFAPRHAVIAAVTFFSITGLANFPAHAQAWPSKPVTLVVGVAAGSALDIYARLLAEQLGTQTGGTFTVDNRPGANGNLSAESVLKAPADGHTLWMGTQSMVTINPAAYRRLRWKPSDFRPIIKGVESPMVLVTPSTLPVRNFADLRTWVATNKGKAAYASFSPGTPSHFLGHQLNERLKGDLVHVPYKGSAPQVNDLIGGQAQLGFTQIALAVPHVQSGKLTPLAVTGPQRAPSLPQVPTLAELGFKDLTSTVWFGVLIAASTPKPASDAVLAAMEKAHGATMLRAKLQSHNFEMGKESGLVFEKAILAESARWAAVVAATGFSALE